MRFHVVAVAVGLAGLAATPSLALTIQVGPPRPDVALHLRSPTAPASSSPVGTTLAPGRPQLGLNAQGRANDGVSSFSFGPLRATTTVTPGYDNLWNDSRRRESGNPLSLSPRR